MIFTPTFGIFWDYFYSFFNHSTVFDVFAHTLLSQACLEKNDKVFDEQFQKALDCDANAGFKTLATPDEFKNWTPLHYACYVGYLHGVNMLLEIKHVDVNALDSEGCSPLYVACEMGNEAVAIRLMEHPGINLCVNDSCSALSMAVLKEKGKIVDVMTSKWPATKEGLKSLQNATVTLDSGEICSIHDYALQMELDDMAETINHALTHLGKRIDDSDNLKKATDHLEDHVTASSVRKN